MVNGIFPKNPTLKRICFWNNGIEYQEYIWPQELVSKTTIPDREKLASYLSNGHVAIAWKGYSSCRICGKTLGSVCKTDGIWIWPDMLEHYILEHNVKLPEEFVLFAKNQEWKIQKLTNKCKKTSEVFWEKWCLKNRNEDLRPEFEQFYSLPEKSEEFELTSRDFHDLFFTVERLDLLVNHLRIPSGEVLSEKIFGGMVDYNEKTKEPENLWTAKIEIIPESFVSVRSDVYPAATILVCLDKKLYLYCGDYKSMYAYTNIEKRFCPSVINKVYCPKKGDHFEFANEP